MVKARHDKLAGMPAPTRAEAAFTAGLLHNIGKLGLAGNLPEMYATAHRLQRNKNIQQVEAEAEMLSTNPRYIRRLPAGRLEVAFEYC